MANVTNRKGEVLQDPPFVQKLFGDPRFGWLWVLPRIWLGYQWFNAASHKITSPAWMSTGEALKGFWVAALKVPTPDHPVIAIDWYRNFIQFLVDAQAYTWFAKLVAVGELSIGIFLILGAFTGIAAFFGAFMNWNFIMAGTASTNPLLLAVAVFLILAWKVSGYIGADFFLLRWVGTPWRGTATQTAPASGAAD